MAKKDISKTVSKRNGPYFSFKKYLEKDYLRWLDPDDVRKAMNNKDPKKRRWGVMESEEEPTPETDRKDDEMKNDEMSPEQSDEVETEKSENPNRQGLIRTIKNAHLVYKRQTPDGTYNELWIYNIGNGKFRDELVIRRAILAGTDIPPNKTKSPDGTQEYEVWTIGNAQLVQITGLQQ
jgi:hypothetical protein